MKKIRFYALAGALALMLTACAPPPPDNAATTAAVTAVSTAATAAAATTSTAAQTTAAEPSREEEILLARTPEVLRPLLEQYYADKNYLMALLAAEKLLELDPADDGVRVLRAELWILVMKHANESLNALLERDSERVGDPEQYFDRVSRLYEEAGFGLTIPFTPDYAAPEEINTVGSESVNLIGSWCNENYTVWWSGLFAAQGDWVYYADYNEGFALYKMRGGGEDKQLVTRDAACGINVMGDWIYYRNISDGDAVYKIRTDGSLRARLSEDACGVLCAAGDWLFYTSVREDNALVRINTDGGGREALGERAGYLFADDGWIYYRDPEEQHLGRMRFDGSERQRVLDGEWNVHTQIQGGWLYFMTDEGGLVIHKMRPDGSERSQVWRFEAKINAFAVMDGRLLVSVRYPDQKESVLAFDLETMAETLRLDGYSACFFCADKAGRVYFSDGFDRNAWYTIDWTAGKAGLL